MGAGPQQFIAHTLHWTVNVLHMNSWQTADGCQDWLEGQTVQEPFSNCRILTFDLDSAVTKE